MTLRTLCKERQHKNCKNLFWSNTHRRMCLVLLYCKNLKTQNSEYASLFCETRGQRCLYKNDKVIWSMLFTTAYITWLSSSRLVSLNVIRNFGCSFEFVFIFEECMWILVEAIWKYFFEQKYAIINQYHHLCLMLLCSILQEHW